jgi:hypothetical protein
MLNESKSSIKEMNTSNSSFKKNIFKTNSILNDTVSNNTSTNFLNKKN